MPYLAIMMWVKSRISNRSVLYVSILVRVVILLSLLFLGRYYLADWTEVFTHMVVSSIYSH